jgi:hypothetical protein
MILGLNVHKNSDAALGAFLLDSAGSLYNVPKNPATANAMRGLMMRALPGCDAVAFARAELFLSMYETERGNTGKFGALKGDALTEAKSLAFAQQMTILEDDLYRLPRCLTLMHQQ